ncbi:MAG TPA: hypothetical protein VF766_12995, partial [Pyrinomonadaceae bacterium]
MAETNRLEAESEKPFYGLLPALRRLDERLKLWLDNAQAADSSETDAQPYPGLWLSLNELSRLLEREPGAPTVALAEDLFREPLLALSDNSQLGWLAKEYGLSSFDLDVMLIALAPELDLRYERIFAYLQDDITCKRPTVDLALNLLCPSASVKRARREHFAPGAPLIRNGLLQLVVDSEQSRPELAEQIILQPQVVNLVLGRRTLDARLSSCCQLIDPAISLRDVPISADLKQALPKLVAQAREIDGSLKLYFHGPRGASKRQTAEALAAEVNSRLLVVELKDALSSKTDFDQTLSLIFREARFRNALLYFENLEALEEERAVQYRQFLKIVNAEQGVV